MTRGSALLVDLDGTLADTGDANFAAYATALEEVGIAIEQDGFDERASGRSWRQFLPEFLTDAGVNSDPAEIAARKAALYPRYFNLVVINGALVELIRRHRAIGPVALVTTASRTNVEAMLDHFALRPLFDLVITGDDVDRHKPDPQAYQIAAERLGVQPGDCLVIEDSDVGVAAGRAFGAPILRLSFPLSRSG